MIYFYSVSDFTISDISFRKQPNHSSGQMEMHINAIAGAVFIRRAKMAVVFTWLEGLAP
jgi:hypothetical protein